MVCLACELDQVTQPLTQFPWLSNGANTAYLLDCDPWFLKFDGIYVNGLTFFPMVLD